jgi:hypothetical protein
MNQALHSRYNPLREAEKYVNALNLRGAEYLILIEPGLGYMIPLLAEKYPEARIIALHVEDQGAGSMDGSAVSWHPESGTGPEEFLSRTIPDLAASAIKIVEWRPALVCYGEAYLKLLSAAAAFIKRSDANFRTVKGFGRRWFRNFFKNLKLLGSFPVYENFSLPVVITGSGPGLEESLPLIAEMKQKDGLFILAASSSVKALVSRGLIPDMVISTDGGPWALLHLYECFRRTGTAANDVNGAVIRERAGSGPRPPVIAAALSAALPSQCAGLPLLAISDGSFWQSLILQGLKLPHIPLTQRGTVSASAIDLALKLGSGKVFIAGMDLAVRDIRTHVRPYSFDRLLAEKASRINPVYSQAYVRSAAISDGGSHQIYASWFGSQLKVYPDRLYTLGSNNQVFQDLKAWTGSGTEKFTPVGSPPSIPPAPFRVISVRLPENPGAFALAVLGEALTNPLTQGSLMKELSALLFPGRQDVTAAELADEIGELGTPYCGVCHG